MAEVKWIKITTNIFSDEKIKLIEQLPEGDTIIVIWFKLLCMAGRENNNGIFLMNNKIAYTEEMLATIFQRPLNTVRLALATFEAYGMIDIVDEVIMVNNWQKHQNVEGLDKIREQNRLRQQRKRDREKQLLLEDNQELKDLLLEDNHVMSRDNNVTVTQQRENKKENKKKIIEEDIREEKRIDYQLIADMYNDTCVSFPRLQSLSETRKKAIRARLNTYSVDDFKRLFEKAEASDFLKGANDRNWSATFDWMIKDSNMAKVLEGNYDNKVSRKEVVPDWMKKNSFNNYNQRQYDYDALEKELLTKDREPKTVANDPELAKQAEELKKMLQEKY